MPNTSSTVNAGGQDLINPIVGPVGPTVPLRIDVSGLTTYEVDADGNLKPGVPFKVDGTLISNVPGLVITTIAGGSAGDHTVTGVSANDTLLAVLHDTSGGVIANLTGEFSITAANTINNDGGTDTSSDLLIVIYEGAADYVYGVTVEPVKIAASNATAVLAAAADVDVAVAVMCVVNRDAGEDNLGRVYTAAEIAAFKAAASRCMLLPT